MRKYIVLLVVLLVAALWLEPLLRTTMEAQAGRRSWVPVLSDGAWTTITLLLWVTLAAAAVLIVVRVCLYVWREVVD